MPAGLVTLAIGILVGATATTYIGTSLFLAGVLLFVGQIVRIAFGGPTGARS
jgi:uncharacterized membrane protein YgdD (TMEM256/DUF423 family)